MVTTYTLARVLPSMDWDVREIVAKLPQVKEVIMTYGEYDLIIKIQVESLEELDQFIFTKLRTIEGIAATTTLLEASPTRKAKED